MKRNQKLGKKGESAAVSYLKKKGYKIIEQNYRTQAGEIDIIAKKRGTLVFVEVKTRRSRSYGSPKYAVTPKKQKAISKAALYYLKMTHQEKADARFDVVSILDLDEQMEIELVCNAFDLAGEAHNEQPFEFEDIGGNGCGCPEASGACKAISAGLAPPEPLDETK